MTGPTNLPGANPNPSPNASANPNPQVNTDNLRSSYANVCRIAQTPNEVLIDFGINPNFFGNILDEPLRLDSRIIMSHDAAKRLCLHLMNAIQNYEAKYGVIELDVAKRLKDAPSQGAPPPFPSVPKSS